MTGIQSPQILTDLYRDLRDRKLLPLVVVLLVGMAVVPIALSSKSEPAPVAPPPPAATASANANAPAQDVVVANPGVRDYKRRLDGDTATDPFVQQFTAPANLPAAAGGGGSTSSSAASPTAPSDTGTGTSTPPATSGDTGGAGAQIEVESRLYSYNVKVRTGELGQDLKTRESVERFTALPNKSAPVATFLGVTLDNAFNAKSAVFLVNTSVSSVDGDGSCTYAGTYCQLLYLKPGEHEDFVWVDGLVYRIEVVSFDLVVVNDDPSQGGGGDRNRLGRHFTF